MPVRGERSKAAMVVIWKAWSEMGGVGGTQREDGTTLEGFFFGGRCGPDACD